MISTRLTRLHRLILLLLGSVPLAAQPALASQDAATAALQPQEAASASPRQEKRRDVSHFNLDKRGLAIDGYDPVAYFPEGGGKARKGSKKIQLTHRGVTYRFASKAHLELFEKNPDRFEPTYGGWCAYSMGSQGKKVDPSPKNFVVQDGRLYLFFKGWFGNGRKAWLKEGPEELRRKADTHWATLLKKKVKPRNSAR